jgi:hypothetical protein
MILSLLTELEQKVKEEATKRERKETEKHGGRLELCMQKSLRDFKDRDGYHAT